MKSNAPTFTARRPSGLAALRHRRLLHALRRPNQPIHQLLTEAQRRAEIVLKDASGKYGPNGSGGRTVKKLPHFRDDCAHPLKIMRFVGNVLRWLIAKSHKLPSRRSSGMQF